MSVCTFGVDTHGQLGKRPHPVLESMYRIGVGLDTSLIPTAAISYQSTDSYGGIFMCSRYPSELRWWLIHVGMSLWYVARLVTYLDLASIFKIQRSGFDFKSNLTSAIGYSANCGFLASYVSCHKAMTYDTRPHEWSCQTWWSRGKKTFVRKKINRHDREVVEDVRTVLPSNTCKVLWEWEIKISIISDYFGYFIECYL